MAIRLIAFFLVAFNFSYAQIDQRTIIPGTKCSMIPPNEFELAENFSGFQNADTGSSIMIVEMPAPYQHMADGFTAEALKTKGILLKSKKVIDYNGSKATFIEGTQSSNGLVYLKQVLIFGNDKNTVLVNANIPESSKEIEGDVKKSLLTAIYEPGQNDNPLDAANFTIDVTGTDFKFAKSLTGAMLYNLEGKIPSGTPGIMIANSVSKITVSNKKQFSIDRLKKLPDGASAVIRSTNEITIDGMNGYEIIAEGKSSDGKKQFIYQAMVFNEGSYYLIVGMTTEKFDEYLKQFKSVAHTFKRK